MVSATFSNLKPEKRQFLKETLIEEFSEYSLDQAQVARIVKKAGISRGSFYTYFDDLYDAYAWSLQEVLISVHHMHTRDPFQGTIDFINDLPNNPYYDFLDKYFQVNEVILRAHNPELFNHYPHTLPFLNDASTNQDVTNWLAMVSTHRLTQERFAYPENNDVILETLTQLSQRLSEQEAADVFSHK